MLIFNKPSFQPRIVTSAKDSDILQANSSIPVVQQNMDTPAKMGAIFYNSIRQNQSYAVAGELAAKVHLRLTSLKGHALTFMIRLLIILPYQQHTPGG